VPGNLEVTVLDAKTSKPISGASVNIAGHDPSTDATDSAGMVKKKAIWPDNYTATASNTGYSTETGSATVKSNDTAKIEIRLKPITVTIALAQPVACPGHPLAITATGDPAGGTYAWTISAPAADLVDAGGTSVRAGNVVNLRGFQADASTGNIPAQTAAITVTYTYTNGQKATAKQDVTIHAINFVLTNNSITKTPTTTKETATTLTIGSTGPSVMYTNPSVEIQLDASCPRKTDCAGNHRVGWLQTCLTNTLTERYTDTEISVTPPMPVRDALPTSTQPFYGVPAPFTGDKNKQASVHGDNPGVTATWTDPRPGAPGPPPAAPDAGVPPPSKKLQLRQVTRAMTFTAWLVVQNIEWAAHDVAGSLAFLGNFDWGMSMTVTVDTTKAVASKATPASTPPTVPATISAGKGGSSPNLAATVANTTLNDPANVHIVAAPELP
jgi:hypothetical protein